MSFHDQVVIVTGATRGIGKEVASTFVHQGATVIIVGRDAEMACRTKEEFTALGLKAESYGCDVTNLQNVQEMANKILDKHNRIDILVNNAGIAKDNLLLRMSEDDWNEVMNVNLRGVFNCTKVVIKAMLRAKKGKIINVSSVIGITGNTGQANYAASKAGIIGFTKSIAKEFASRGITVNAVAPGYIQTEMTDTINDTTRQEILKTIPLGRFGTTKDVANMCSFLASSKADYITGQTFVVDGGMTI